ncbi:hypothetical protein BaRGS_00006530 [Batillaria attramentaria]|uniref:BTB domain-containing protein n=1 Tax=Batillaria attramentaria TaxID=370345 RepID=A0ABD0LRQ4_9CAEN
METEAKKMRTEEKANPFDKADQFSDVVLKVDGRKLHVHKMILARSSPVFNAMFFPDSGTGFKEKNAKEVALPDKNYDEVVNFLTQLYPEHSSKSIKDNQLLSLLALAEEYQVEHVRTKCDQYISQQVTRGSKLSSNQVLMYLWAGHLYNLHHHNSALFTLLGNVRRIATLKANPYYQRLPLKTTKELLEKRCDTLEKENEKLASSSKSLERYKAAINRFINELHIDSTHADCDAWHVRDKLCPNCGVRKVRNEFFSSNLL